MRSLLLAVVALVGSVAVATAGGSVSVRLLEPNGEPGKAIQTPALERSPEQWRARLTKEQYEITRTEGTERAFCGIFHDNHKEGLYACIGCGLPLFRSDAKFDSGTGWPSFFQPFAKENIGTRQDTRFGMVRTEIHCIRCGSHQGHLFTDGPEPSGLRYCINSAALTFFDRRGSKTELLYLRMTDGKAATSLASQEGVIRTHRIPDPGSGGDWAEITIDPARFSYSALMEAVDISALLFTTPGQEAAIRKIRADLSLDLAPPPRKATAPPSAPTPKVGWRSPKSI